MLQRFQFLASTTHDPEPCVSTALTITVSMLCLNLTRIWTPHCLSWGTQSQVDTAAQSNQAGSFMTVRAETDAHKRCCLCFSSKYIHRIMSNDVKTIDNLAEINNLICIAKVLFFQLLQRCWPEQAVPQREVNRSYLNCFHFNGNK